MIVINLQGLQHIYNGWLFLLFVVVFVFCCCFCFRQKAREDNMVCIAKILSKPIKRTTKNSQ